MKTREMKESDLEVLKGEFAEAQSAFVVEFKGLTVVAVDDLRRKIRTAGGTYRVVKNTLARRASEGTRLSVVAHHFKGSTAIIRSGSEPTKIAKTLTEFAKTNPALVLKGASVEGVALDAGECKTLADLPSREELLGRLLYLLKSPMQRLASVLSAPKRNLAIVLNQVAEKQSRAEGTQA
jgi:large subunit ribosomal protein L10